MTATTPKAPPKRKRRLTLVEVLVIVGLGALFLSCLTPEPIAQAIGPLMVGWARYAARVFEQARYDLLVLKIAGACLVALVVALHWLCSWLYRQMAWSAGETSVGTQAGRWRWRWTIAILGMVLLTSAAGISVLAIVHQSYWLATSPKPLVRDRYEKTWCAGNMRQIGTAILIYAAEHQGRFPDRLEDLCADGMLASNVFVCPSSGDPPAEGATTQEWVAKLGQPGHLSYVYMGQGLTSDAPANRPVLYEPISNHDDEGGNVLFADGHVEYIASRRGPDGRPVLGMELPTPATAPTTKEWSDWR